MNDRSSNETKPAAKTAHEIEWEKWQASAAEREAHWAHILKTRTLTPARVKTRSHRHGDGMPESR